MREFLALESRDAAVTAALGARLGRRLADSRVGSAIVIYLNGELGAGKTTFVGGLLREIGVQGPVRSPTYTLIEPYEVRGKTFYHLDLYRLQEPRELEPLGLRELLVDGATLLVEWAERGGARLPPPDLSLDFRYQGVDARQIHLVANTNVGKQLAIAVESSSDHG